MVVAIAMLMMARTVARFQGHSSWLALTLIAVQGRKHRSTARVSQIIHLLNYYDFVRRLQNYIHTLNWRLGTHFTRILRNEMLFTMCRVLIYKESPWITFKITILWNNTIAIFSFWEEAFLTRYSTFVFER